MDDHLQTEAYGFWGAPILENPHLGIGIFFWHIMVNPNNWMANTNHLQENQSNIFLYIIDH